MAEELMRIAYHRSDTLVADSERIIETAQGNAYQAVNLLLVERNWLLGKRISEEIANGDGRTEYGSEVMKKLARALTAKYGRGFTMTNLYYYFSFYRAFPEIFHSLRGKSSAPLLSWTHYRTLLQVNDEKARQWYAQEAATENWSTRTLQRNISSQYYYRMLKTQSQDAVKREMQELTAEYQKKLEFIKSPVIAEFLGMQEDTSYLESDLEQSIINNLQKFLMELGKGYAFVARQQRIHTEKEDYFIDLVFYNYILKCFVLIDLKTKKITHQDVGQMDMYIRMYDERKKQPDDHPTIGIILCADTDSDIARYSIMNESDQLFASKYKLYLPTEEELRTEIETQKELFYLQHADKEGGPTDEI